MIPPMGTPVAPHLEFAGEIKREVAVPVMHASRINDVATARHAIREGLLDLVGMTRAQIADPHIVAKIPAAKRTGSGPASGQAIASTRSIRPGMPSASTTRRRVVKHRLPHWCRRPRQAPQAVVVGAGPAGLEAARVLGERGHGWSC